MISFIIGLLLGGTLGLLVGCLCAISGNASRFDEGFKSGRDSVFNQWWLDE
jgi:hypothetical protein